MNKGQKIVSFGIAIAVIALLVLEAWSLINKDKCDTISELVAAMAMRWPIITFVLGLLIGHWIWPLNAAERRSRCKLVKF